MPSSRADGRSVVVYTAIADDYLLLKEQPSSLRRGARFVAFLDSRTLESQRPKSLNGKKWLGWEIRKIPTRRSIDPWRLSKPYKIRPHLFFPEARYSFWIDGSIVLISQFRLRGLVDLYLTDADLCVFSHPSRDCVYAEGEVCKKLKLDDARTIDRQIARYRAAGYPKKAGLVEATAILRRHTPAVEAFNETWWREIRSGSRRDQLSFNYAAWKCGLKFATFPGWVERGNGILLRDRHRGEFEGFRRKQESV